jgi:hypothetical protein
MNLLPQGKDPPRQRLVIKSLNIVTCSADAPYSQHTVMREIEADLPFGEICRCLTSTKTKHLKNEKTNIGGFSTMPKSTDDLHFLRYALDPKISVRLIGRVDMLTLWQGMCLKLQTG